MGLIKYKYDASDTLIYQTDLYSGGDADITATERFSNVISLDTDIWANISIKFTGLNAISDLEVNIYKALTSTFDGDEERLLYMNYANDGTEDIGSFMIKPSSGPGHYRIGFAGTGSTSFDAEVKMRLAHLETI